MKAHVWMRSLRLSSCGCPRLAALLSALIVLSSVYAIAQVAANTDPNSADGLTISLLSLHTQYQSASPEGRKALIPQLRSLAAQRQQLLSSLIQTNPAEVLRVAIPNEVSAHMPASVQTLVEKKVQAQGALEVTMEDWKSAAKLHHYLKTSAGRFELKFASQAPKNLLTGATVQVQGVQVGNTLALTSGTSSSSLQVVSSGLTNTLGAQSTLVMLVNFQIPVSPMH